MKGAVIEQAGRLSDDRSTTCPKVAWRSTTVPAIGATIGNKLFESAVSFGLERTASGRPRYFSACAACDSSNFRNSSTLADNPRLRKDCSALIDRQIAQTEFVATDSVRWFEVPVDVSPFDSLTDVCEMVCGACEGLQLANAGHQLAVRVRFSGSSKLHTQLAGTLARQNVADMLADKLRDIGKIDPRESAVQRQACRVGFPNGRAAHYGRSLDQCQSLDSNRDRQWGRHQS